MNEPERTAPGNGAGPQTAESQGAGSAPEAALGSASVSQVEEDLKKALADAADNHERYLRAVAEGENIRRRAQDDVAKAHKFAIESFAEAMVPVADSLEKALDVQTVIVEEDGRWAVDIVVVFADGVVRKRIHTHATKARADIAADLRARWRGVPPSWRTARYPT